MGEGTAAVTAAATPAAAAAAAATGAASVRVVVVVAVLVQEEEEEEEEECTHSENIALFTHQKGSQDSLCLYLSSQIFDFTSWAGNVYFSGK